MRCLRNALLSACLLASVPAYSAQPWVVRFDGIGPLRYGMTFDEVNARLGKRIGRTPAALLPSEGCDQVPLDAIGRKGIWLMFVGDVFVRVDVQRGAATAAGIAPGMLARRVLAAYREVDKWDASENEQLLTVHAPDRRHAIRFEMRDGKVDMFYAGEPQAVALEEGCL